MAGGENSKLFSFDLAKPFKRTRKTVFRNIYDQFGIDIFFNISETDF